ncbi:MAG: septum formation inhibitor Maf [Gammaproteobacteria bacterium]|nr:septum formation inhibitor Maf [Gammaproteobacteria bacterium]
MEPVSPRVLLASGSPRRRKLLEQIGLFHETLDVALDETPLPGEAAADYVLRLAVSKAEAGARFRPSTATQPVLAADTTVAVDGRILGKPLTREVFLEMMERLSGRTHQVITGVALVGTLVYTRLSVSQVTFREILPGEAQAYWETGEPRDKAGGYGIQGMGAIFVSNLQGSFSGVMGLPLFETAELLQQAGIELFKPLAASRQA